MHNLADSYEHGSEIDNDQNGIWKLRKMIPKLVKIEDIFVKKMGSQNTYIVKAVWIKAKENSL